MTRDEAKKLLAPYKSNEYELINKIFDDFEKEKSCDGCKYKPDKGENYPMRCGECERFYADMFEERK